MNQKEQKWLVLLFSLNELNGGNQRSIILQHINDCGYWYKNDQNDILRQTRKEMAWRNDFSFERQHLVEQDYMKSNGQGRWEITDKGNEYLSCLIEKAVNRACGSETCYTAAFFQKLIQDQAVGELEEDQILITKIFQIDSGTENTSTLLLNEPQPKGPATNRSANGHTYLRSPSVAQRALNSVGNLCEVDPMHRSFLRKDGATLYMEPHHLIPMALTDFFEVNLDREQNIFSLCSNCHNQIHYGAKEDVRKLLNKLFLSREHEICSILGKEISIEELYRIYDVL